MMQLYKLRRAHVYPAPREHLVGGASPAPLASPKSRDAPACASHIQRDYLEEHVSSYDPRDLFSGEHVGQAKALAALLASPQNNLRVVRNGHVLLDGTRGDAPRMLATWEADVAAVRRAEWGVAEH